MRDEPPVVRAADRDDDERVWPLTHEFATSFTPEYGAFAASWAQLVTAGNTLLLVAETFDGNVVGYLLATSHLTLFANGPVAWIEEVMVDERARRTGVGRRLVHSAEQWARSVGAQYIALATRRAGPFYLALGYEDSAAYYRKTFD